MKPPIAHVTRTALVVAAAAGAVWLSAFFLPAAGVQPVPLLPSIGSVAGKVVAVSRPHQKKPAAAPHRTIAALAVARVPFEPPAPLAQPARVQTTPRVVHRPQRAHRPHHPAKPKHSAPAHQAAVPASTPASATPLSYYSAAPRGKAVGWHRKHDESGGAPVAAPTPSHGKSHGNHRGAPPAQPAAAPTPTPAAPAAPPPPADGHDNGQHRGDDHDHGDNGHGPGGKQ